jgi:hypothetical protein
MENEIKNTEALSPEQEMERAQQALAAAKMKLDEASKLKLAKAAQDLAEFHAAEEHRRLLRKLEIESIQKRAAQQEKEAADARIAEQRRIQNEQMALEAKLNLELEEQRKREDLEKETLRLSNEAFRIEKLAEQEASDALRLSTPVVEDTPVTLSDPRHPLSRIFAHRTASPEVPVSTPAAAPVNIELRLESEKEKAHVAQVFDSLFHSRPNSTWVTQILRRHEPKSVISAAERVSRDGRFQNDLERAIEALVWQTSDLDTLWKTMESEAASALLTDEERAELRKSAIVIPVQIEESKQVIVQEAPAEPAKAPNAEPVQIELRKIEECEVNHIAMRWQSELNTRPTGAQVIPLLQRFTPAEIVGAILAVSADKRFMERDTQSRAVSCILWRNSSLDALVETLAAEQARREAERKSR